LEAWLHVCWCPALLENAHVTWSTTTAWIPLTAGLEQTIAFCMIAHLYHDLYQVLLGWFCGLTSELELAHSCAVHPANSHYGWAWCQCQWQGAAPRPTGAHFTPSTNAVLEHFGMVGDGKGSQFMHLLRNALHLTLPATSPLPRLPL
jgi:hypothetical protein